MGLRPLLPRIPAALAASLPLALALVCGLWLEGAFLPRWVVWTGAVPPMELPAGWLVQDAFLADIRGGGARESVLVVWKRGSYGRHRPFWVTRDESGFSQHIFLYEERQDGWHPFWMSSRLGIRVRRLSPGEAVPGRGGESLVVTEPDGTVTRWGWRTWGLARIG